MAREKEEKPLEKEHKAPDQPVEAMEQSVEKPQGKIKHFFHAYWAKKKWTLPLTLLVLLLVVIAVRPYQRYMVLGLFMKQQVTITVQDNATRTPVSGAAVAINGQNLRSNGSGKVETKVKLGRSKLTATKQYYTTITQDIDVTLAKAHNTFTVSMQATGRQVPLTVVNKITGKGVADVTIKVLDTEAKTDKDGKATVVVPATGEKQAVILQHEGFNDLTGTLQATNAVVEANTFALIPAGKLYFLSNRSGKLDVVKTNLDGSERQIVLAGTGNEDVRNTSLLASRDWKHLVLLSKRATAPGVYLISTSNDKLTTIDEGKDVSFSLAGWSNDTFVYQVNRNKALATQPSQAIKSYNATTGKLTTIDQPATLASEPALRQTLGSPYLIGERVLYAKNWSANNHAGSQLLVNKQAELAIAKVDGSGKKVAKGFSPASGVQVYNLSLDIKSYAPEELYIYFHNGAKETFYEYENDQVKEAPNLTVDKFWNGVYPTYLQSPTGNQTFWTELRDGKDSLFLGNKAGENKQQVASLSEFTPYGWYTDSYLLVSKKGSELYILPADGSATPYKITDYYKPAIEYRGYGGGYGGL